MFWKWFACWRSSKKKDTDELIWRRIPEFSVMEDFFPLWFLKRLSKKYQNDGGFLKLLKCSGLLRWSKKLGIKYFWRLISHSGHPADGEWQSGNQKYFGRHRNFFSTNHSKPDPEFILKNNWYSKILKFFTLLDVLVPFSWLYFFLTYCVKLFENVSIKLTVQSEDSVVWLVYLLAVSVKFQIVSTKCGFLI